MNSAPDDRRRLSALLAALDDPALAAALPADDEQLVRVARHHRLTALLSVTCGASLPAPLAEAFRRDRILTSTRNLLLGQAAEACIRALDAAGVPTLVLKGLDYEQRLYAGRAARPTGDVDLLVPGERRRDAFGVLDRLGFEPRAVAPGFDDADYHEVAWARDSVEIDLHLALAPLARCRIDYGAIWAEAEPFRLGQTDTRVLVRPHAAIFQALHMAIDHFAVPAVYLLDLARLLPDAEAVDKARALATGWHCRRPLETSLGLLSAFLPSAVAGRAAAPSETARRIARQYGSIDPLPRPEQLLRKLLHFDSPGDAIRYLAVQSRRNLREVYERRVRRRSARERLSLSR